MRRMPVAMLLAAMGSSIASPAEPADIGRAIDDAKLRGIDGNTVQLYERGAGATVVVFFRPGQERSADTLAALGRCREMLAGKPVRWLVVAPAESDAAEVKAALASAKLDVATVIDDGDALYGAIGVRTLPAVLVLDKARRLAAYEGHHPVGFADIIKTRVRRAMGEISDADATTALTPAKSPLPGDNPLDVASRHVKFGRKLFEAKAYSKAHESARKSLEISPSAAAWALEGEIFAAEGKCADAARSFDAAFAMDPKNAVALEGRGRCKQ